MIDKIKECYLDMEICSWIIIGLLGLQVLISAAILLKLCLRPKRK